MKSINNLYIPEYIIKDNELPANAKLLYSKIAEHCMQYGFCNLSNRYFSEIFNVSTTSISKWISALENQNYIMTKTEYMDNSNLTTCRYIYIVDDSVEKYLSDNNIEIYYPENSTCYLYVFKDIYNNVKIGISINPKNRCAEFKDRQAHIVGYEKINNAQYYEKLLHDKYSKYRLNPKSEWFNFGENTNYIINEIFEFLNFIKVD